MLADIRSELTRVAAEEILVALDDDFEPNVGTLLRVERDKAYWHMLPEHFLELLRGLPDGVGADLVHQAIEKRAVGVWHGSSPKGSMDSTS